MNQDVIIIGGGPAGIVTALTAKSVYPDKSICVIRDIEDGVIPCAIPYMINTMEDPIQNLMGVSSLEKAGIKSVVGKVVVLDIENKKIVTDTGEKHSYEKLVLATGTENALPKIPGINKKGVFSIRKSLSAMKILRKKCHKAKKIVIIGGGFIGAEFADELRKFSGIEIHIIEAMPKILYSAFDDDFCDEISKNLSRYNVNIHTNEKVLSINGKENVESITLENGEELPADLVMISIGAKPANTLVKDSGIRTVENGAIWVDDYMRTNVDGIFAVGDCAVKRDFFTRKAVPVLLASTAAAEARNAGTNLYGIRVLHQIQGTIAVFSTQIAGVTFASTGMTCRTCEREGFRYITAQSTAPDRHPGSLPDAQSITVKLIFSDKSGILLGGQMVGGASVGELINVVSLAIQKKVSVRELDMMQIATHPMLTPAPTVHPIVNAAHIALAKMRRT